MCNWGSCREYEKSILARYGFATVRSSGAEGGERIGAADLLLKPRADQGLAGAQFNLGLMYYNGQGVRQDYVQAHMWLNLAASRASGDDQRRYADARESVAKKMTAQQIVEAQRRAREWKPGQ